jgi:hypothetical protein
MLKNLSFWRRGRRGDPESTPGLHRFVRLHRLALPLLALLLWGCSEPEHVSPAEFKQQYEWVGKAQSVRTVTYLGQRDGRAFIRLLTMHPLDIHKDWSPHVIYVNLAELDPAFRDSLPKTEIKDAP